MNNPKFAVLAALAALNKDEKPFSLFSLKYGYEYVWKTLAEKENLNVQFQIDITNIQTRNNRLYLKTWQKLKKKQNFVIFLYGPQR